MGVYSDPDVGLKKLDAQLEYTGSNYRAEKGMSLEEYKKGMNIHTVPIYLDHEPLRQIRVESPTILIRQSKRGILTPEGDFIEDGSLEALKLDLKKIMPTVDAYSPSGVEDIIKVLKKYNLVDEEDW